MSCCLCRFNLTAADASDDEMTAEVNIIVTNTVVAHKLHLKIMYTCIYPGGGTKYTSYLVAVYVLVVVNMCGSQPMR